MNSRRRCPAAITGHNAGTSALPVQFARWSCVYVVRQAEARMTQANLLQAYATHRDAESFAQIVRQYQRFIFATCRRRLQNADDVDDAVQETFLRLAQKAGELHSNIGGWLHTCAVN